jgi:hypothetical protein
MSASTLFFLEAVPLVFIFAWLMILTSGIYLVTARLVGPLRRGIRTWQQVVAAIAGLLLAINLGTMFRVWCRHLPLFSILLLLSFALVSAAAWCPTPKN